MATAAPSPPAEPAKRRSRRAARRRGDTEPARREAWRKAVEGAQSSSGPRADGQLSRERPRAPWHPLPLSELVILAGAVGVVVGLVRGQPGGSTALLVGFAAVALGTIEVALREHLTGFRSHALLLALLPVLVFHSLAVLIVSLFARAPRGLSIGLLVPDFALGSLLFRGLRARFTVARRAEHNAARSTRRPRPHPRPDHPEGPRPRPDHSEGPHPRPDHPDEPHPRPERSDQTRG